MPRSNSPRGWDALAGVCVAATPGAGGTAVAGRADPACGGRPNQIAALATDTHRRGARWRGQTRERTGMGCSFGR
jgi:hypothetical protein